MPSARAIVRSINGVLIGMVHVLLPYMVFPIYAVMRRIDPALLAAAEGLGAPGWQSSAASTSR